MTRVLPILLSLLFASVAFAGQEEPTISNGIAVWPQYYNGSNFRNPRIDASTRATTTIDYSHHEAHGGSHYFVAVPATVQSGATVAYLLATPPTTARAHLLFQATGSAITDVQVTEGVTTSVRSGTPLTIFNNDRDSLNTSGCTFSGVSTNQNGWGGTTIYRTKSGSATAQSRGQMTSSHSQEIILKSGVTYVFHFISGTADNLTNLQLEWYMHTPKDN